MILQYQNDSTKFQILSKLYSFYEESFLRLTVSCEAGCSQCCTVNVVATGLEMSYMIKNLKGAASHLNSVERTCNRRGFSKQFYRPIYSINHTANAFIKGVFLPDDTGKHGPGICPLLDEDGLCTVYQYRPFSCRAMSSQIRCDSTGEADMLPFLIAVNFVIYQIIEHLDKEGKSGNMLDILHEMLIVDQAGKLVDNQPMIGYSIDPDFYKPVTLFLEKLLKLPVGEGVFADFLPDIR